MRAIDADFDVFSLPGLSRRLRNVADRVLAAQFFGDAFEGARQTAFRIVGVKNSAAGAVG